MRIFLRAVRFFFGLLGVWISLMILDNGLSALREANINGEWTAQGEWNAMVVTGIVFLLGGVVGLFFSGLLGVCALCNCRK